MRLKEQLSKVQGADLDAMAALQNDRYSVAADILLAGLEEAIKKGRGSDAELQWAATLEQLVKWDRIVDNRPVVSSLQAFEQAVWRRTFVDEMEEALFDKFYEWAGAEKPAGLRHPVRPGVTLVRRRDDGGAEGDARRHLPDRGAGRGNLPAARIWRRLAPQLGRPARRSLLAPLGSIAFPFAWLFNRGPVPLEGDGTTVMRVSWNRLNPFQAWEYCRGASSSTSVSGIPPACRCRRANPAIR